MAILKFYNIIIYFLAWFIRFHALWNVKSRKLIQGRKQKILLPEPQLFRIWIHCASLGEFEQGRPLIDQLKEEFDCEIIITFFSPSGYEVKRKYHNADHVFYLPFDTKSNAKEFIETLKPDLSVFVKYEFWWNLLQEMNNRKIPVIFISAQFRLNQYIFKAWAKPFLKILQKSDTIFVADGVSQSLLYDHGFTNVALNGDTRAEGILTRMQRNTHLPFFEKFKGDGQLIIMGSTYAKELPAIKSLMDNCQATLKIVIFPHEINDKTIIVLKKLAGDKGILYSEYSGYDNSQEILIVDCIGLLADAYRYSDVAYVGGGFNKGIHNILEPLVYKIPIIFGPKHHHFAEAIALKKYRGIATVNHIQDINTKIFELLNLEQRDDLEVAWQKMFGNEPVSFIIDHIKQSYPIHEKRKD